MHFAATQLVIGLRPFWFDAAKSIKISGDQMGRELVPAAMSAHDVEDDDQRNY